MKSMNRIAINTLALAMLLSLGACAGMSRHDQNTAVGAGVGAVAGSILTSGSPIGTVGGAVVGGVIGDKMTTHGR